MSTFYNTNLAAAILLESARHAVRLGIEGTMTLDGETIPEPEREVHDDCGEPIGIVAAVAAQDRELARSPAQWLEALEPHAASRDFSRVPLLAGARWEVPIGSPGVLDAAERRWASGYDTIPVRRSVQRQRLLTESELESLQEECGRGSYGASNLGPWRASWRGLVARARVDWERLPFVQKMQDEIEGQVQALRRDCWDWADLLTNRLGVASGMEQVHQEWIATLDGYNLTVRFDVWLMAWIAAAAPMAREHKNRLHSLLGGDWDAEVPDPDDVSPTMRDLLALSVTRKPPGDLPLVELGRLTAAAEAARDVGAPASQYALDLDSLALNGGYNVAQLEARCRRLGLIERRDEDEAARWLVENLIPARKVILMAGEGSSGKSTILHELAVKLASEDPGDATWLGRRISPDARGEAVFISLEEDDSDFEAREKKLDPDGQALRRLNPWACKHQGELPAALDSVTERANRGKPIRLVVIDSASKFREGSEIIDSDVNAFLDPLERLARETGAAVVVIHHLKKAGQLRRPGRSVRAPIDALRERISGHPAFINRPRLVLGMIRDTTSRGASHVICVKENLMLPDLEGRGFMCHRDEATWNHVLIEEYDALALRGPSASASRASGPVDRAADESAALAALAALVATGQKVTKTGQKSLFSLKHQSLSGIPRARIDAAVSSLVESGRVQNGANGLTLSEEPHSDNLDDAAE